MSTAVEVTVQAISAVVQTAPIGTNLALVHILWVMMSGAFLPGRGTFFTAFDAKGFDKQVVRRSWAALRHGAWTSNELLDNWQIYVASENHWRVRRHERYQAVSVDMTGFWRPHLKGWAGKHFHSLAQKALPAVVFGVIVVAGEVKGKRIPLLRRIVRCEPRVEEWIFERHCVYGYRPTEPRDGRASDSRSPTRARPQRCQARPRSPRSGAFFPWTRSGEPRIHHGDCYVQRSFGKFRQNRLALVRIYIIRCTCHTPGYSPQDPWPTTQGSATGRYPPASLAASSDGGE